MGGGRVAACVQGQFENHLTVINLSIGPEAQAQIEALWTPRAWYIRQLQRGADPFGPDMLDHLQQRALANALALEALINHQPPHTNARLRRRLRAQRFLSIHPGNRDAPYAYYLIALNYYEQITDVTRDQKITQQALDAMGELIRRYPTSRYAADARLKVDLIRDHLAGKEMEIGRFYERRAQWLAAVIRFRTVVDKYDSTSHTPEALMRLTEAYLALGIPEEAKKAAAVLGTNYPGSKWYDRAYDLMRKHAPTA